MLDMQLVYDTIWRDALIQKLEVLGWILTLLHGFRVSCQISIEVWGVELHIGGVAFRKAPQCPPLFLWST